MRIGELKNITGVSARSIRHYEEKGLITSSRQDNNYREFDEKVIDSIHTIQLYLGLGLTTEQIKEILFCKYPEQQEHGKKDVYCEELMQMYEAKMSEINKQMAALSEAKSNLSKKINQMREKRRKEFR